LSLTANSQSILRFSTLLSLLVGSVALAEGPTNKIIVSDHNPKNEVTWTPRENVPITAKYEAGRLIVNALLTGGYAEKGKSILINSNPVTLDANGTFEVQIPIQAEKTTFEVILIDQEGTTEKLEYTVELADWPAYQQELTSHLQEQPEKDTKFHLLPSLGVTAINYSQSSVSSTSEFSPVGKLGVTRNLSLTSPLELGLNVALTFLPFGSSGSTYVINQIQFLWGDLYCGMNLPWPNSDWNLKIIAGIYYNTMVGNNNNFGYQNALGFELFPVLSKKFANRDIASAYIKFSPVSSSFQFLPLNSHEVAGGLGYTHGFSKNLLLRGAIDFSAWQISYQGVTLDYTMSTASVTYFFSLF
jgi:hypothetical protein